MYFFKCSSRIVHNNHLPEEEKEDRDEETTSTSLTVWRKSLMFNCNGFTVIGPNGSLIFRVDNYYSGRPNQIILMDGQGYPIFTIHRHKNMGLARNEWFLYEGEVPRSCKQNKVVFRVRKKSNIMRRKLGVLAHVYSGICNESTSKSFCPSIFRCGSGNRHVYSVEGSYRHRSCKIMDESRRVVAEMKMKETKTKEVSFGLDVFHLNVKQGIESRLAMAIVLLLDQMF